MSQQVLQLEACRSLVRSFRARGMPRGLAHHRAGAAAARHRVGCPACCGTAQRCFGRTRGVRAARRVMGSLCASMQGTAGCRGGCAAQCDCRASLGEGVQVSCSSCALKYPGLARTTLAHPFSSTGSGALTGKG